MTPALAVSACVALLALPAPAPAAPGSRIPDRYIVVYDADVRDPAAATARRARAQRFKVRRRYREAVKGFVATLNTRQLARLRDDPAVRAVVPDRVVRTKAAVPLAAGESTPPTGVRRMEAATTTTARQASTEHVAVIDTGIKLDHPDLNAANGVNCVGSGPAGDDQGHGTHVAGTIGARNQGSGVVGMAPGTKLVSVKVLDASGGGSTSSVVCGIDWVASTRSDADPANDIAVANLSLGGLGPPVGTCAQTRDPMHLAICRATARGVTFVVAAGNDGIAYDTLHKPPTSDPCHTAAGGCPQGVEVPAAYPDVLTVTAISDTDGQPGGQLQSRCFGDDVPAPFSNFASTEAAAAHTIAAAGGCIRSTGLNTAITTMSGTSMAAPHVAGLAALCLGEAGRAGPCAGLVPADLIQRLRGNARDHLARTPGYGFSGDPSRPPSAPAYFGHLGWTMPVVEPPPDTLAPAPTLETPPDGSSTTDTTPTFGGTGGAATGDSGEVTVEVFSGTTTQQLRITLVANLVGSTWSVTPQTTLEAGTYSARVSQRDAAGNVGASAPTTFSVTSPPPPPADTSTNPPASEPPTPPATAPDPVPPPATDPDPVIPPAIAPVLPIAPPAPSPPSVTPSSPIVSRQPAELEVTRASIRARERTLEVVASLTARATGRIRLAFAAGGRTTRFSAPIGNGRVRVRRPLSRAQVARGGGTVTIVYPGDATTRPQEVRLRADALAARLTSGTPRISDDGRLIAGGTVASRARGSVRITIDLSAAGAQRAFETTARIRRGRWRVARSLPATVRADITSSDGPPQARVLFGGDARRRVGGALRSSEVLVER